MAAWLLLAETTTRITYGFGRLQSYTERWHYLALAAVCAVVVLYVGYMYRRDSIELHRGVGWLLSALRIVALTGLLAYYLDLERRTEERQIHPSRALVTIDTSLSMGLHDADATGVPAGPNRLEQVAALLQDGKFLSELRKTHEVIVTRFDTEAARIIKLDKLPAEPTATATAPKNAKTDWQKTLLPQGGETRIGQSMQQLLNDERAGALAGMIVFTDGGQNAGIEPGLAIDTAREAGVPIYTVGIGSERRPANVRIADMIAPTRAYPNDSFTITGYIQGQELGDRAVTVELTSRAAGDANKAQQEHSDGVERVSLGSRGEIVPVKFDITPTQTGRRVYKLRIKAPRGDTNPADDQQEADVEIVDRKTRVLLMASGPARDYVFLRNQLKRDKDMIVDVLLQSAPPGTSQDAHKILDDLPTTPQEMFEYDCLVAFDPDWTRFTSEQIELVERWVSEKAGGIIVAAGPVETHRWVPDPKMSKVRALYPVEFNRHVSLADDGRFGSETPWPLQFTREGSEAEFLWLADTTQQNERIWASLPGVYGYYPVRGPKSAATVYARYTDPEAGGGERAVYMAGQFYGSGRVFYLGSGEMWRLRALEENYFDQIYTRLVRHVSQGRLLVGSSHGMLLVDRDRYVLGNTVTVKAQLSDARFEPLDLPAVTLQVIRPDGTLESLRMAAERQPKGMFSGQFTVLQEGTYRLELAVPNSEEQLSRRIQVKVPDLEREHPERNDALLSEIAKRTGGLYYVGAETVLGTKGMPPLAAQLKDRTETTYLTGVPDRDFQRDWLRGLLFVICGTLSLEWLIRRLLKLA